MIFTALFDLSRSAQQFIGLDWTALPAFAVPLLLFALRAGDLTLATLRMLTIIHGLRLAAWLLGFSQAAFFLLGASGLFANLGSPLNLAAYAAGFATGNVVGLWLENRLAPGHSLIRVTSLRRASAIVEGLWQDGWGATAITGRGMGGTLGRIYCYVPRRAVDRVKRRVLEADPEAFLTSQPVRSLAGGWKA